MDQKQKIRNVIFTPKALNLLGTYIAFFLVLFSYLLEFYVNLEPCALCIIQRYLFVLIAFLLLVAAFSAHKNYLYKSLDVCAILLIILGLCIASRHIWLITQLSEKFSSCSVSLGYIFTNLPFTETVKWLFNGTGNCHDSSLKFLGLYLPFWTFSGYLLIGLISILAIKNKKI